MQGIVRVLSVLTSASALVACGQVQSNDSHIEAFISAANQGWVQAARRLDDSELGKWFAEDALADLKAELRLGKENASRIDNEKPQITFKEIHVEKGSLEARVVTQEGWAYKVVDVNTERCQFRRDRNSIQVSYRLRKTSGMWKIVSVEQSDLGERPPRLACTP